MKIFVSLVISVVARDFEHGGLLQTFKVDEQVKALNLNDAEEEVKSDEARIEANWKVGSAAGHLALVAVDAVADWEIHTPLKGQPLHEEMMSDALKHFKIAAPSDYPGTLQNGRVCPAVSISEYLRGVVFNDDPGGFLYRDEGDVGYNATLWKDCPQYSKTLGIDFAMAFKRTTDCSHWKVWSKQFLCESHHGRFQFIHSMSNNGQTLDETKDLVLQWAEFTYKVGTVVIADDALVKEQMPHQLALLFTEAGMPSDITVKNFFCMTDDASVTQASYANAAQRAIGSFAHMVQDSYSTSHTNRNPSNWKISKFIDYKDNADVHAKFDKRPGAWWVGSKSSQKDFDKASAMTVKFIEYYHGGAGWDEVKGWLSTDVFDSV